MLEHKEYLAHSVTPPLFLASSWTKRSPQHPNRTEYSYGRIKNPSYDLLQEAIQSAYGSVATLLCPSGLSAVSCSIHGLLEASKSMTLVYNLEIYHDSEVLVKSLAARYPNLIVKEVDLTSDPGIHRMLEDLASTPERKVLVFTESCSNPNGKIPDTMFLSQKLREAKLDFEMIVDNSWLSILYNPFEYGADVVVESLSKYVGGGDVIMGMVTAKRQELLQPIRTFAHVNGVRPSPYDCNVCLSMFGTLSLRLNHVSVLALKLAKHLSTLSCVKRVTYPLLPSHSSFGLASKVLVRGGPGVLCFCLPLTPTEAMELMDSSSLILFATSYGKAHTLLEPHPHHTNEGTWIRLAVGYSCSFEKIAAELDRMLSLKFPDIETKIELTDRIASGAALHLLRGGNRSPAPGEQGPGHVVEYAELARFLTNKGFHENTLERVNDLLTDEEKRLLVEQEKTDDPKVLVRGWLSKKVGRAAKKKFCVIECGFFRIYDKDTDDKPEATITLSRGEESSAKEHETMPLAFLLSSGVKKKKEESFWFAGTIEERMKWVACLVAAINGVPDKAIGDQHQCHELTADMMHGIRSMIGRTNQVNISNPPTEKEFVEVVDQAFPSKGSKDTAPHKMGDFGFKDYAPSIFRRLRARFGIEPSDYLMDVCGSFGYLEFVSNSKSGEFFFHSHNRKYMIKTISHNECRGLRNNMSTYYHHMMGESNTFINKFFGLHKVKPKSGGFCWFLIMGSVFPPRLDMHLLFDLKGSTHGRSAKPSEMGKPGTVYKDNDFVSQKITFDVGPIAEMVKAQLSKDVKMLENLKIIDYSVLCGIHFLGRSSDSRNEADGKNDTSFSEPPGPVLAVDDSVLLFGLASKEYNWQQGVIILEESLGRFDVRLSSGEEVRIKRANLKKLMPGEEAPPPPPYEFSTETFPPAMPLTPRTKQNAAVSAKSRLAALMEKVKDSPESSDAENSTSPSLESRHMSSRSSSTSSLSERGTRTDPEEGHKGTVERKENGKSTSIFCQNQGGLLTVVGPQGEQAILCLGIIDTLIEFGWKKKMERNYKANIQRLEKTSFSVVEPELYAQRLLAFFGRHVVWEA